MKTKQILKTAGEVFGFLFCVAFFWFCFGIYGIGCGYTDRLTQYVAAFLKWLEM